MYPWPPAPAWRWEPPRTGKSERITPASNTNSQQQPPRPYQTQRDVENNQPDRVRLEFLLPTRWKQPAREQPDHSTEAVALFSSERQADVVFKIIFTHQLSHFAITST